MNIALIHDHFNADKLNQVIADMRVLGAPSIKAVWMKQFGHFAALEGCHRIRAAHALGLDVTIDEVEYSDELVAGMQDDVTVSQLCDDSYSATVIKF